MAEDDLRAQNEELRKGIKLRLRLARFRAGFATLTAAAKEVDRRLPIAARTYRDYESGPNVPGTAQIHQLERFFKVPHGWIAVGDGKANAELEAMLKEVEAAGGRKAKRKAGQDAEKQTVNQLTANILQLDIKSSQSVPSGRIPVLLGGEIASFLASGEVAIDAKWLTVPDTIPIGPKTYAYVIPDGDTSMVSKDGLSFVPGDELIFDAAVDVEHGKFLLIRPKGDEHWLLRRYEGGAPFFQASEFVLSALNPAVSAIRVTDRDAWEYGGRLMRRLEKF